MSFLQGEVVALIVAICMAIYQLIKLTWALKEYYDKIKDAINVLQKELSTNYGLIKQEQEIITARLLSVEKKIVYHTKILRLLKPDAFRRVEDETDY